MSLELNPLFFIKNYISEHSDKSISLNNLSELSGLSPHHLQRKFKKQFGISPKAYHNGLRFNNLKRSLKEGDDISGAIYEAGFGSSSRVYEQIDGRIGMTPGAYRAGGKGEDISYAIRQCVLGR